MNQQTVNAIYQNGVLRPIGSLDLPENSEVELEVKIVETKPDSRQSINELLVRKGLSLQKKTGKPQQNLSKEEGERILEIFGGSKNFL